MGRQTEDLSSQVDGVQSTFTTTFQRTIGTSVVTHNGAKVAEDQVTEPSSKQIALGFVPALNDELFVVYFTDETVDGRVQGFSEDPTTIPPPAFPQGLQEILEDLDARIDGIESDVEQPPDPKDTVQVGTLADLGATYDDVGGTGANGSFTGAPLAVDGVTVLTGFRVLAKDQTNLDENGVYVVLTPGTGSDGVWERAPDFITGAGTQVTEGARLYVSRGTQQGKAFLLSTPDPITVGGPSGSALVWIVGAAGVATASNLGTGAGKVFAQLNAQTLEMRTIRAGPDILVSQSATEITITSTFTPPPPQSLASVLGVGASADGIQIQANAGVDFGTAAISMGPSIGTTDWRLRRTGVKAATIDDGAGGAATISCPGAGALSEHFGATATAAGNNSVAFGSGSAAGGLNSTAFGQAAVASADNTVAVGTGADATLTGATAVGRSSTAGVSATAVGNSATASGTNSTALGLQALASATASIAIGPVANSGHANSIVMGLSAKSTATNQFIVGGSSPILDVFIGRGVTSVAPTTTTYHGTRATTTQTDKAGGSLVFSAGEGTGAAVGSTLSFQTPTPTGTGTAQQALATRLTLNDLVAEFTVPVELPSFTVGTLPAVTTDRMIMVSDDTGGLVPAFSDGTNWRRVTDRAIVAV